MRRGALLAFMILAGPGMTFLPGFAVPAHAEVPVLVVDGKGWGHGVGMAQDGAYWMGVAGADTGQILSHFYPGTAIGQAGGPVRVGVADSPTGEVTLVFPAGGEVRDVATGEQSPGFPVVVPEGGQVRLWFDGAYHAQLLGGGSTPAQHLSIRSVGAPVVVPMARRRPRPTTTLAPTTTTAASTTTTAPPTTLPPTTLPPTTTTLPPTTTTTAAPVPPPADEGTQPSGPEPAPPPGPTSARPLRAVPAGGSTVVVASNSRRYRGVLEAVASGQGLHLVDELDVEQYLRGMGEVRDPGWPPAALRAQAIAARTYAMRAMAAGGEICDDDRCQVYLGQGVEYAAMDQAVADTKGQVVTFAGGLASTFYSANAGGFSASAAEGFGGGDQPYLTPAPYSTSDPMPWTVKVNMTDLATRIAYPGEAADVRVSRTGPSGRALELLVDGSAGTRAVDGRRFARALGLKSTLFTLHVGQGTPVPPPPPADNLQVPPDSAATAAVAAEVLPDPAVIGRPLQSTPQIGVNGGGDHADRRLRWAWTALILMLPPAAGVLSVVARMARPRSRRGGARPNRRWSLGRRHEVQVADLEVTDPGPA